MGTETFLLQAFIQLLFLRILDEMSVIYKNSTELALKKNREYEIYSSKFLLMTPSKYKVTPHKRLSNLHKPQEGIVKIHTHFLFFKKN